MERKSYLKYDWDNVSIIPAPLTDIDSRKDVSARDENNKLPLFISPMDTVVDEHNAEYFLNLGYEVCLPRGIMYEERLKDCFFSYGLDEIIEMMNTKSFIPNKILIDIANGHMSKLYNVAKDIKENYNKVLMIGNIANPETYRLYSELGVDYIRCGIGGGCFTPNSLVETENGLKRIVDITIGDKVRTHKNRFRKVTQLHTFEKNEKLLYINDIECTKNHEFYVIFKSDKVHVTNENINEYAFWLEASELDKDKYLLINFIEENISIEIERIEEFEYTGLVYDLTVEEDESYNIESIIVHNSACTTSANSSTHYPMASLIRECYEISATIDTPSKIVADGGFKKYADIIKAIGLGADSVMLGGIINKSLESCSPNYILKDRTDGYVEISIDEAREFFKNGVDVYKYFRGMSTKEVQKKWGNERLKTSEGITKYNKVEYTLDSWTENFEDYLKSTMSYSNKRDLNSFIGNAEFIFITSEAFNRFDK